MAEAQDLAAAAVALRDQSGALNADMHRDDVTPAERDEIAARKRALDAEAFDIEEQIRALEEAAYGPDFVSTSVPAVPLNMNGGGS